MSQKQTIKSSLTMSNKNKQLRVL